MSSGLAHFGTFDVENYGDLLFPLLLERRLADVIDGFVHVSPSGGVPSWGDCRPTLGVEELLAGDQGFDAVAVGGGHTIHAKPTGLDAYRRSPSAGVAYPAIWMVPAYLAEQEALPLWWNAPGVPGSFSPRAAACLRRAVAAADYVAVRDAWSVSCLREAGVDEPVEVAPDTGLEASELWSRDELDEAYAAAFGSRGMTVPSRSLAFHCNRRYIEDAAVVGRCIEVICRGLQATPILLALGPCHGDSELQPEVARHLKLESLVVDQPASLREVTACIARSQGYVGSSLHGMIVAISFRRPGIVVASEEQAGFRKFSGLLEQMGLEERLCTTWQAAEVASRQLLDRSQSLLRKALERGLAPLDLHWRRVRQVLVAPAKHRLRGGRRAASRLPVTAIVGEILAEQVENVLEELTELRRHARRSQRKILQVEKELRKERRRLVERDEELARLPFPRHT